MTSITFHPDSAFGYHVSLDGRDIGWVAGKGRKWFAKTDDFDLGEHRSRKEAVEALIDIRPHMSGWRSGETAPKDGRPFVFKDRSPATYELSPPIVGRYWDGELQCYTGSRWRRWTGELDMWAEIPGG